MTDRTKRYGAALGLRREGSPGAIVAMIDEQVARVMALADTELAALEQECRDRECTERDVRARLADAENTLAKVRGLAFEWDEKADKAEGMAISRKGLSDEPQLRTVANVTRRRATELRAALDGTS